MKPPRPPKEQALLLGEIWTPEEALQHFLLKHKLSKVIPFPKHSREGVPSSTRISSTSSTIYPTWLCVRRRCAWFTRTWWRYWNLHPIFEDKEERMWIFLVWFHSKGPEEFYCSTELYWWRTSIAYIMHHDWVPSPSRGLGGLDWQENEPGTSRPTPSEVDVLVAQKHCRLGISLEILLSNRLRTQDGNYVQLQNKSYSMSLNGQWSL